MQHYVDFAFKQVGTSVVIVPSTTIQVNIAGTSTKANIYSDDNLTPKDNPFRVANNGMYDFYAADGLYDIVYNIPGGTTYTVEDIRLEDPTDGSDAVFSNATVEDLSVSTSAALPALATIGSKQIANSPDLAASGGSALVGHLQSGTGAVSRTLQAKVREQWFSIADFGAVADATGVSGVGTDNTTAIQRALDAANLAGGGVVFIPPGKFRKADNANSELTIYSNTTIMGVGDASVLFFDDSDAVARSGNDLLVATDVSNIALRDFKILGTALEDTNQTNQKQCLTGAGIDGLRVENVTFYGLRYMATAFSRVKNGILTGNRLEYIVRDGLRCTHSYNVIVSNNTFKAVSDDAVALHSKDDFAETVPSGFVVSNNTFEQCQGIKVLGAKALNVTGNVFRRSLRSPINIEMPNTGTEGNTPQFSINISDNIIEDTFAAYGTIYSIHIEGLSFSDGGTGVDYGVSAIPYSYNYLNDLDTGTPVRVPMRGVTIRNNTVRRTLPAVTNYSDYGYGELFDRTTTGFFSDPAITSADFQAHGIEVYGPVSDLIVSGNLISGMGTGFAAIRYVTNGSANFVDFNNVLVESNVITDSPGVGLSIDNAGSSAKNIVVRNNIFDLDPFFRAATHNADNTWSSSGSVIGIQAGTTISAAIIRGNVFKNLGNPSDAVGTNSYIRDNYVFTSGAAASDSASNKGVRNCSSFREHVFVIYDADPASGTYGTITNFPLICSSLMPSTGTYLEGAFVRNPTPTVDGAASSQYVVNGWLRKTTGSGHVLNTDWIECRCLTGT
jgi:hypothetical protein